MESSIIEKKWTPLGNFIAILQSDQKNTAWTLQGV